jgi:hypothetical protein
METWLSGRKHLTANEAGSKSPPGFESLRLRTQKIEKPAISDRFFIFTLLLFFSIHVFQPIQSIDFLCP